MDAAQADELAYAEASEVERMLATEQNPGEHIVVQLPSGEVCPVIMGGGMISHPMGLGGTASDCEVDVKRHSDGLESLRPGRAVIYRFEERGEIWLLQSSPADPTVLQVQATLDTGQLQFQQQQPPNHVAQMDGSAVPIGALQSLDMAGTMAVEMGGEELIGSEVTEVESLAEVNPASGGGSDATITSDVHQLDVHHQVHGSVACDSQFGSIIQTTAGAIQGVDSIMQSPIAIPLETEIGPLVGAEETTSNTAQSGSTPTAQRCPTVTSVLQKKLTQADRTPLVVSGGRSSRGRQGGPIHQCGECGASFGSTFHLRRHQQTHTGARPYPCSICNLSFRHKTSLTVHIRRHTGEMPYLCNPANFKVHVRSHSDEKNYECKFCGKRFNSASTLYAHNKTHENVKPFTCGDCKKSFRFNTTLVRHTRTHTGEKPYACDRCELCFATASNLAAHRRRHVSSATKKFPVKTAGNGQMYECTDCGQTFHTRAGLKVHMKQRHQLQPDNGPRANRSSNSSIDQTVVSATSSETATSKRSLDGAPSAGVAWESHPPTTVVLQCSVCSKVCLNEQQMTEHMATHKAAIVETRPTTSEALPALPEIGLVQARPTAGFPPHGHRPVQQPRTGRNKPIRPQQRGAVGVLNAGGGTTAPDREFHCETCEKAFDNADVHKAHMRTHNISKGIRVVYTMRSVC